MIQDSENNQLVLMVLDGTMAKKKSANKSAVTTSSSNLFNSDAKTSPSTAIRLILLL